MHRTSLLSRLITVTFLTCSSAPLQAGKYSSGGGRSYSSSTSRSYSTGSVSRSSPAPAPARPSAPAVNTSSSASRYSAGNNSASNTAQPRPAGNTSVDAAAAKAKQMQQSAQSYSQSHPAPAPVTNNTGTNRTQPLPPLPPRNSYSTRTTNSNYHGASNVTHVYHYPAFSSYYSRPLVVYHDSYSSPFWYWLLDQPRYTRAEWYYHHQSQMDPARQAALVAADPELPQAVSAVATAAPTPNPDYTPPGIEAQAMTAPTDADAPADADAASSSTPANSLANQVPPMPVRATQLASMGASSNSSSSGFNWLVLLGCGGFVTWLVFFKRWKSATA